MPLSIVEEENGRIAVSSPYHPNFPAGARSSAAGPPRRVLTPQPAQEGHLVRAGPAASCARTIIESTFDRPTLPLHGVHRSRRVRGRRLGPTLSLVLAALAEPGHARLPAISVIAMLVRVKFSERVE